MEYKERLMPNHPARVISLANSTYKYGLEILCNCGIKGCHIVVTTEWYSTQEARQNDIISHNFKILK